MRRAALRDSELLEGFHRRVKYVRENKTEAYVTVPPALIITDSNGATWTLGTDWIQKGYTFFWGIYRNDVHTGEQACRLEYRQGQLRALTPMGSKLWVERSRREQMFSASPGYWV